MPDANPTEINNVGFPLETPFCSLPEFVLLRETHHRLMNNFALMAGYLRRESQNARGGLSAKAVMRLIEMISAQAELHRCLALRQTDEPISLDAYMIRLCRCLSDAVLRPLGITCEVAVDAGYLPTWKCERLGLIAAELIVNAAKHAFGGRSDGKVCVRLRFGGEGWQCVIADNGRLSARSYGTDHPPKKDAVGSQLVESLVRTLGGTKNADITASGMSVVITFPTDSPNDSSN